MLIFLYVSLAIPLLLLAATGAAWLYGRLNPERVLRKAASRSVVAYGEISESDRVAILIASFNGASTIYETVQASRRTGCDVYVVSDASRDETEILAEAAGAKVYSLPVNSGKPAALHQGYRHFRLGSRYDAVAILDDDVLIEPNFVQESLRLMTSDVAIVVGKNITWWPRERRWNPWLAKRAFSYWNYQLILRRLQSHFGVMNCISGSNSVYRTELLDQVLPQRPPYIVDDTFWVLETHRERLGRIVYAPRAHAHLQDPTNFRDWYKQNLRWLWGTFQGVIGHRVGRQWSRFDVAYVALMAQWFLYVVGAPAALVLLVLWGSRNPWVYAFYFGGYAGWVAAAALQLRRPRLILFVPAIALGDLLYRIVFVHAVVKALRQPTVAHCKWESPTRIPVHSTS